MTERVHKRLFSTFGRVPGTWLNLSVITLSGLAEGLGVALFVPLIELMGRESGADLPPPFDMVIKAFKAIGLPVTLLSMLGAITCLIFAALGLSYLQRHLLIRSRQRYRAWMRREATRNLFLSQWKHLSTQSHGEYVNVLLQEATRGSTALLSEVMCAAIAIQITIYLVFSATLSWQLMVVALVYGGIMVVAVRPLQVRARIIGKETDTANRDLSFHAVDYLKGAKLVKTTGQEARVLDAMDDHIEAAYRVASRNQLNLAQIDTLVQALPVVLLAGIIAIAQEALDISASLTLVFLLYLARLAPRMAQFQQYAQSYNVDSPAVTVVDRFISQTARHQERTGGVPFTGLREEILFDQVSYRYAGSDTPAVTDVSLSIPRGQMIALVGSSGSGKSTLIDLIAGLRTPQSGSLRIDGRDLAEIDLLTWRQRVGYVTQEITIFNDSLRNNLLFTRTDATEDDIAACLELAHLTDFVRRLPEGLDTVLGESGTRLSGGQKQRLALARALLSKPDLLLLDEATSALDNESERIIQKALESIAREFTIIAVAHRLPTVRRADVIYVLENGRIVEFGDYDTLAARGGRFSTLLEFQNL